MHLRSMSVHRVRERDLGGALDARQMRAFVSLVEHGSLSDAARALGVAQSTMSELLAALERALGARVVARGRGARSLRLTDAGQALLPHARAVLSAFEAAHAAVASVTPEAQASVAIIASESVSTYLLPQAIAPLRARWPNTRFPVTVATCPGVRAGVADGTFDVGILVDPADTRLRSDDLVAPRVVLAPDVPLAVFASPGHPLADGGPPARPGGRAPRAPRRADLFDYPLFVTEATGDFETFLRAYLTADGLPAPKLEVAGTVGGVKTGVAADPRALGILPAYALLDDVRQRRVVHLPVTPAPPRMTLAAILSPTRTRHPSVAALLDEIRRALVPTPAA